MSREVLVAVLAFSLGPVRRRRHSDPAGTAAQEQCRRDWRQRIRCEAFATRGPGRSRAVPGAGRQFRLARPGEHEPLGAVGPRRLHGPHRPGGLHRHQDSPVCRRSGRRGTSWSCRPSTPSIKKISLISLGGVVPFFLPNLLVLNRERKRREEIQAYLPDVVDLLEICVSSGIGLDMAWNIVAEEIHHVSEVLGTAMDLSNFEMHLGASRTEAMRNMAARTGRRPVVVAGGHPRPERAVRHQRGRSR